MGLGDPGTALGFAEEQLAVALHLGAELDDVATPYPGIGQQIEGQPRLVPIGWPASQRVASSSDQARMPSGLVLHNRLTSRAGSFVA